MRAAEIRIDCYYIFTAQDTDETENLNRGLKCAKDILAFVNQSVKDCENKHRLEDLQRRLRISEDIDPKDRVREQEG